jgi:hypothetical protein
MFFGIDALMPPFMSTMKDLEFLAEASEAKLDINPLDGAILEATSWRFSTLMLRSFSD